MPYETEKKVALEAAIAAAQLCQKVRRDVPDTLEKSDKSPVTIADYGSQALVCRALGQVFPNDPIVGEEDAKELRSPEKKEFLAKITSYVRQFVADATPEDVAGWIDRGNGEVCDRYWTLDPIDGTKGFLRNDQYAVALALVEKGDLKVGAMACPNSPWDMDDPDGDKGVLYMAARGEGATKVRLSGGEPVAIRVAAPENATKMRFVQSVESSHGDEERQRAIAKAAGLSSPPVLMDSLSKYGVVASGQAALYVRFPSPKTPDYREKIWDHAAGAIVVEEAGGKVTDMYGKPLDFSAGERMVNNIGIIVSNGSLHDRVLAALQEG